MLIIKNNIKALGIYVVICLCSLLIWMLIIPPFESKGNLTINIIIIILITVIILGACFFCGRYFLKNLNNWKLNILSTLSVLIVIIFLLLLYKLINPYTLSGIYIIYNAPTLYSAVWLSVIMKVNQTIVFNICSFLPYVFLTIGAIMK